MGYENALKFGLFEKVLKNTCRAAEMWKKSAFYAHSLAHKKVVFIVDGTLYAIAISSVYWNEKWNNKKKRQPSMKLKCSLILAFQITESAWDQQNESKP